VNGEAPALLAAAERAARDAGAFVRAQVGTVAPAHWTAKVDRDFVTRVDRDAEAMIAAALTAAFPGSRVVGEELTPVPAEPGARPPLEGLTWIVDPLDGTTNFVHGYPQFAVSIAAAVDGNLAAGAVYHVTPGLMYTASAGGGACLDGRRITVSVIDEPGKALIGTGFPFKSLHQLPRYQSQFAAVTRATAGIRRAGSAALDLCDVAAGRFDGFWELWLAPWDVAAGTLIVREAGGLVTGGDGSTDVIRYGPIVAGNAKIHDWLLKILNED
jgi:myo-inositol-1(or 4)-monophosphatase